MNPRICDWMKSAAAEIVEDNLTHGSPLSRHEVSALAAVIAKHAPSDRAELAALRVQREQEESGDGNSPLMLVHRDAFSQMQAEKQSSHNRSEHYRISNLDYIARAETAEQQNKALRLSSQSLRDALEGAKAAITNLGEELAKIASAGLDNFENTLSQEDGHRFGAIANTANFARTLYGSPALKAITAALSATARTEGPT